MTAQQPAWTNDFVTNVTAGLQAIGGLDKYVTQKQYPGASEIVPIIHMHPFETKTVITKGMKREVEEVEYSKRYMDRKFESIFQYTDILDKSFSELTNIDSMIVKNASLALARGIDRTIIDAFFSDVFVNSNGTKTTETFPTSSIIAADYGNGVSDVPFTIKKIEEADTLIKEQLVMTTQKCIGITPRQHSLLRTDISATSEVVYTQGMTGQLPKIYDFTIYESTLFERLYDGTHDRIPVWDASSMHMGWFGEQVVIEVIQNDANMQLSGQNLIRGHTAIGAIRSNQNGAGVIQVKCSRTI